MATREVTLHQKGGFNTSHKVEAVSESEGAGRAATLYRVSFRNAEGKLEVHQIQFQNGSIEHGFNGLTNESLIAIVIDRLKSFQDGPFSCVENAQAIFALDAALNWLIERTKERCERGVEGQQVQ